MKALKFISFLIIAIISTFTTAMAEYENIQMYKNVELGIYEPIYQKEQQNEDGEWAIKAWANPNNFPISSSEQGSIFSKIFKDLSKKFKIHVYINYPNSEFKNAREQFEYQEISKTYNINAIFGEYYEKNKYSKKKYIYPSFGKTEIFVITPAINGVELKEKDELVNYRGVYSETDVLPNYIIREFEKMKIKKVPDYNKAFEEMLSGKADYVVGSYYPSLIEVYKLGIKDYVLYSKNPVWSAELFIKVSPLIYNRPEIKLLVRYLKSSQYKKRREETLNELIEIYKENTKGVVPPTYLKVKTENENITENQVNTDKNLKIEK